ncbi:MAG: ABC-F family ATP-binding cassette domain-containing protein [Ruminococcaceae bacterium]|nr:ABC-F family ATP-binding cassette domain-containing protein [Oscillospiraceae bacterium]
MLLNVHNLKKSFGDELLFDRVSFSVDDHDKIGFVGINGAGKSTLIKILLGEMSYDSGEVFKNRFTKIGYLDQYACNDSELSVLEETLTVYQDVMTIEQELEEIRWDIEQKNGDLEQLVERQNKLSEQFAQRDGFVYRSKARATLLGLGFSEEEFSLPVKALSGGQKTRVSLGKILLSDANLLFLDEPTNHLDIASVEWLEEFLVAYKGAFIIISHDRYFLDKVTNKTFELKSGNFYSMNGNYSAYAAQSEIAQLSAERKYENIQREIKRLEGIVEQQRRWNREKNIKTAESKQKVIDKLKEDLVEPDEVPEETAFSFRAFAGGGKDTLICEELAKRFDEEFLFEHVSLHITKGEKVFLVGANGCGKTTLLKIITGAYEPTRGDFKIGANTFLGYYDQIQENLHLDKTILDEVWDEYPKMTETQIRNALAAFLFRGEDVFKEIKTLSGGERARVELVKLILKEVNFLLLDEPTNHLDIGSREALEKALSAYDGTLLCVSHDRYFMNRLATKIVELQKDGIRVFDGNYDDYLERIRNTKPVQEQSGGQDYREQKRLAAEKRKKANQLERTEQEIEVTEQAIETLNAELEKPEIAQDYEKVQEISVQIGEQNEKLEQLYQQWEQLHQELEELE